MVTRIQGESYIQFGKKVLLTQLPFRYLDLIFEVDEHVQRNLDIRKRNQIREFILNAVEESGFQFSSFVFSARKQLSEVNNGWELPVGQKLIVLDGQHRLRGLKLAIQRLETSKINLSEENPEMISIDNKLEKLKNYPICMQIYLDLSIKEERQLFSDINTERRELHGGIIVKYDKRDKYSEVVRNIVDDMKAEMEIEETLSKLSQNSSSLTTMVAMRRCIIAMIEGKTDVKEGEDYYREIDSEVKAIGVRFFRKWIEIFPKDMTNRYLYVCGLTTIQLALAYTVNILTQSNGFNYYQSIEQLDKLKQKCTWKHSDPIFSYYYNTEKNRLTHHSSPTAINKIASSFVKLINS